MDAILEMLERYWFIIAGASFIIGMLFGWLLTLLKRKSGKKTDKSEAQAPNRGDDVKSGRFSWQGGMVPGGEVMDGDLNDEFLQGPLGDHPEIVRIIKQLRVEVIEARKMVAEMNEKDNKLETSLVSAEDSVKRANTKLQDTIEVICKTIKPE